MRSDTVLVTAAGPSMRPALYDLALPTFRRYAARWGHAVHVVDLPSDGQGDDAASRQARWAKIPLLLSALADYEYAVWLDADVLICRDDDDITGHLVPGTFQALALEQVPSEMRVNPNTGVWLLRRCPEAFAFLRLVEVLGPRPGPWADQGAVLAALGWERGDGNYHGARPGRGNGYLLGTAWLPPGWNQPCLDRGGDDELFHSDAASYRDRPTVAAPHALHFMGMRPEARYQRMAAALAAGIMGPPGQRPEFVG